MTNEQMAVNTGAKKEGGVRNEKMLDFLYLQKSDLGKRIYQENASPVRRELRGKNKNRGKQGTMQVETRKKIEAIV